MAKLLTWIILTYKKLLSPLLGPHCRFYPSCSSYFIQALEQHGALKGSMLGMKRICSCHPLNEGGYDPVPQSSALFIRHREDCNQSGFNQGCCMNTETESNTQKTGMNNGYQA